MGNPEPAVAPLASIKESAGTAARTAELAAQRARQRSLELADLLRRTAQTLDHSAGLAEEHARRHQRYGRLEAADEERRAAARARAASKQARANAEELELAYGEADTALVRSDADGQAAAQRSSAAR